LLFVGDPGRHPERASETVARLFGLTPAEAQVAASLASGETPREYAERRGLSEHTVRWTIKQVQTKLGLKRQLDIASAVLRATPNGHR
jgi:DNA-binding CsgD family transcriptional regulator